MVEDLDSVVFESRWLLILAARRADVVMLNVLSSDAALGTDE
jgi:hypothetical protein